MKHILPALKRILLLSLSLPSLTGCLFDWNIENSSESFYFSNSEASSALSLEASDQKDESSAIIENSSEELVSSSSLSSISEETSSSVIAEDSSIAEESSSSSEEENSSEESIYSSEEDSSSEEEGSYSGEEESSSEESDSFVEEDSSSSSEDSSSSSEESSSGEPIDVPVNVFGIDQTILSIVYSSIAMDLTVAGYTVFNAKKGSDIGLAYMDSSYAYLETDSEEVHVPCGFISFFATLVERSNLPTIVEEDFIIDEIEELSLYDGKFENALLYSSLVHFDYVLRANDASANHFIASAQYVQYQVNNDRVEILIKENNPDNYRLVNGSLFDFDQQDYQFIPFDDIPSTPLTYTSLARALDAQAISNSIDEMLSMQEENGYELEQYTVLYLDAAMLDTIAAALKTKNSLNGVLMDDLNSLLIDPDHEYVHFESDGMISIHDYPALPTSSNPKGFWDWIGDSLIVAGGTAIAICLMTFAAPYGGLALGGMVLGAVGEYFAQTFIGQKSFAQVNWAQVGISAAFGALLGGLPLGGSFTAAGLLATGLVGACRGVSMSLAGGVYDTASLIERGAFDAFLSMAGYGLGKLISRKTSTSHNVAKSDSYPGTSPDATIPPYQNNVVEVYDQPTLEMVKEIGQGNTYDDMLVRSSETVTDLTGVPQVSNNSVFDSMVNHLRRASKSVFEFFQNAFESGGWQPGM